MQIFSYQNSRLQGVIHALLPNYYAETVFDIDFLALKERGIKCVAVDIDNTLVPDKGVQLTTETIEFFKRLRANNVIEQLAIATNRSQVRLGDIGTELEPDIVMVASGLKRKPAQQYYAELVDHLNCKPEEILMVGDKVIQDIWGGNRAGLQTLLVDPLGPALWFEKQLYKFVMKRT